MEETKERKTLNTLAPLIPEPASQSSADRSRLSVMPLAVLLPQLGDLSILGRYAPKLQRRLQEVQEEKAAVPGDASEEQRRRGSEESMLNQVLQWLAVGEKE